MEKLYKIAGENDVLICLGDLFNKPIVSNVVISDVMDFLLTCRKNKKPFYFIIGNHDCLYRVFEGEHGKRLSLQLLSKIGLIDMDFPVQYDGWRIDALPFLSDPSKLQIQAKSDKSIIIGHYFYESSLTNDLNLKKQQLINSGYKYCILGHDHEYKEENVGDIHIIVPGSISRVSSHESNLTDTRRYAQLDTAIGKVKIHKFDVKPCSEVFFSEAMEKVKQSQFYEDMDELLEALGKVENADRMQSVSSILKEINTPEPVFQYLRELHERLAVSF
jgi:DNA repair exonuclease SbcCD nuclease subunit